MPTEPIKAQLYCRISKDSEKKGLGVYERQLPACRRICEEEGWVIDEIFIDNDISAAKRRDGTLKERPDYNRMMAKLDPGMAVVSYDIDRLVRSLLEMEQFFERSQCRKMHRLRTSEDNVRIDSGEGMMVAQLKAVVAQEEVRKMRKRQDDKQDELARNGKWHGGPRPFGFDPPDKLAFPPKLTWSVVPEEAEAIRDGAARLLAGESLASVCRDWNAKGLRTTFEKEWTTKVLHRMLMAPRLAGLRVHRRPDEKGKPQELSRTTAEWPAIISVADHERLVRMLTDPSRAGARPIKSYLLTGLVRCGHCGSKMHAGNTNGRRGYICKKAPGWPGCGRMAAMATHVDEEVVRRVKALVKRSPTIVEALSGPQSTEDDAALVIMQDCDDRLNEAKQGYADGLISMATLSDTERRLAVKREAARRSLVGRRSTDVLYGIDDLVAQWPDLPLDRKHAVLGAIIDHVEILPSKGGPRFDPERVSITWR